MRLRVDVRRAVPPAGVAAAALATLVVGLGAGPLRFKPKPWNAVAFSEPLTGHVARLAGLTRGIVSLAGEGLGTQRVLVRADLLVAPRRILRTAFQMEYLPSGLRCTGSVTQVHALGFSAVCRLASGERRYVSAQWQDSGSSEIAAGLITSHS